jgi:hypothetical protein
LVSYICEFGCKKNIYLYFAFPIGVTAGLAVEKKQLGGQELPRTQPQPA